MDAGQFDEADALTFLLAIEQCVRELQATRAACLAKYMSVRAHTCSITSKCKRAR